MKIIPNYVVSWYLIQSSVESQKKQIFTNLKENPCFITKMTAVISFRKLVRSGKKFCDDLIDVTKGKKFAVYECCIVSKKIGK